MPIDVGEVIHQKYRLERLLGRGGMGEVWVAHHVTLGEEVAIKFLVDLEGEGSEAARQRFLFEAQVAARLSRKTRHVVSVIDHGEENGVAYLVMELLEGETLEALLARAGRVSLPQADAIVTQITRALAVAHGEGIFHRDLKPANIFLAKDEHGHLLVKLLDFGIARRVRAQTDGSPRRTARGMILGTPAYMSPEQVQALPKLDHRCDLWALAVVAYEMLAGDLPFGGDTPQASIARVLVGRFEPLQTRRPELATIDTFLARALAAKIDNRYPTADALGDAFTRSASGGTERPHEPSSSTTAARRAFLGPSRPRPVAIAVGSALAVAGIAVAVVYARHRPSEPPTVHAPAPPAVAISVAPTRSDPAAPPPSRPAPGWTPVPPSTEASSPHSPLAVPPKTAVATRPVGTASLSASATVVVPPPPPQSPSATSSVTAPRPVNKDDVF